MPFTDRIYRETWHAPDPHNCVRKCNSTVAFHETGAKPYTLMKAHWWIAARDFGAATSLDTAEDTTSLKAINAGLYDDVVQYMRCDDSVSVT